MIDGILIAPPLCRREWSCSMTGQGWRKGHGVSTYWRRVLRGNCLEAEHAEHVRDAVRRAVLREAISFGMCRKSSKRKGNVKLYARARRVGSKERVEPKDKDHRRRLVRIERERPEVRARFSGVLSIISRQQGHLVKSSFLRGISRYHSSHGTGASENLNKATLPGSASREAWSIRESTKFWTSII